MPRQIPLKRARGSDEDSIGCGKAYLQFIGIIIAIPLALFVLQLIADNIGFIVLGFLFVAGFIFVGIAIEDRDKIKLWLASVEERIEQWAHDEKRFATAVVLISVLVFLMFVVLVVVIQKR